MNLSPIHTETHFVGLPISTGTAVTTVCLFSERRHRNLPLFKVSGEGVEHEKARLRHAVTAASDNMDVLIEEVGRRVGSAGSQIFRAQRTILNDAILLQLTTQDIETLHLTAEAAVTRTLDMYEARMLEVDNEYIRERASDIGEVRQRLLDVLGDMNPTLECAEESHCHQGRNRIVVAEELTPSLTVELDTTHVMGFVTQRGGPTSHAAILARALGIPAVSGIPHIRSALSCGTELYLNGDTGEVIVWPDDATLHRIRETQTIVVRTPKAVDPVPELTVMANISRSDDAAAAVSMKAEGVGLYRTEFEFLFAGRMLDEQEQFERYASVLRTMDGRPVRFRLLDIGGDKNAPFFDLPKEDNPYLGFRGSRLLLARTDLLRTQVRALARASEQGPVDIMYPMVVDLEQFLQLKQFILEAIEDVPRGEIRHGVMFEVPSACLEARELLGEADFGCIGTNDLIQYFFAVDRNNDLVAYDYTPDKPVFWSLLRHLADAAIATGRSLSVCGEAAGNPAFLLKLLEIGINHVSVSPRFIPDVRSAVVRNRKSGE